MSHATKISSIQSAQPSRAAAPKSLSQSKRPVWVATTIMIAIFAVFQLSELGRLQAADNGDVIFMSTSSQGSVGGIVYTTEDIIAYDVAAESWSMYFDGSDVTVPADADIGGFAILDDDSLLLTLMQDDVTLPDVGLVDASDIVRFVPTALGETTSGTFEMYFDGSDVNLDGTDEIIDAFAVRTSGQLVISTQGDADVLGFTTADEDALFFTPSQLGTTTTGTWETFYFDGSDVELSDGGEDEDLNALWVKPDTNDSYFSTQGAVSVSGVSGDGSDITLCTVAIAADTSCTSYTLDWDGSAHGLTSQINALHIGPASNLANFTAAPTNGIYPLTVTFTGSSAGADSYLWDFGDGSTSTEITPTHTYGNAGAYTVTLTVTDTGEVDTFTRPGYIAVGNQLQNPDFEWDKLYWSEQGPVTPSSDAYSGSQAVRMGPTESHIWQHPIVVPGHAYVFSGYAKVDASETAAARIGVDFYDANDVLLSGSNTTITSTTYQPFNAFYVAPENASYADVRVWKEAGTAYLYADDLAFTEQANLLQNPDFESGLAHWSDWYDQMALGNDAYDGSQALVIGPDLNAAGQEVIGIPDETYTYSGWAKIDTGEFAKVGIDFLDSSQNILARTSITVTDTVYQSFTLSDTAPANTTAIQVWGWKDDGSGYLYVDTLSLSIGGGITPPQADFTATPVSGTVPLTITFANNSTGAESFLWAFGDGSTSTELLPTHVYTQTGSYTVTLTATGQGGTDSLSRTDYITVIDVDTGDGNLLQNPDFEDGLDSWDTWTGSESVSSLAYSAEQALRIGTAEGAAWQDVSGSSGETYVLGGWAKASDGENAEVGIDFYDAGMNVLDYVYVTITTTTYQPFNVSGVAPANTAYVRAWAWKDAGDDYLYVDDLYLTLGEPTIVQAGFDATPLSGTRPFTVTFSNHSMNAHTYAWDFGDGITSTVSAPTHAYQQAGIYTVSLTATSTSGSDVLNRVRYITVYGSNPDTRVTDGLQALYMFQEGSGTMIHDVSDAGLPLDLTIEDTDAVTWLSGGGLSVDAATHISSTVSATKIISGLQSTNEMSLEAWIKPANTAQEGPARIVSLSIDGYPNGGNFMLGQEIFTDGDPSAYAMRLRTTTTDQYGKPSLSSPTSAVTTTLTHVVFTHDADGVEKLYVDGIEVADGTKAGDFSTWETSAMLGLANEAADDRPWLGELYFVAIYNKALAEVDVIQNYNVGHLPETVSASFTAAPISGTVPLTVMFTNNGSLRFSVAK